MFISYIHFHYLLIRIMFTSCYIFSLCSSELCLHLVIYFHYLLIRIIRFIIMIYIGMFIHCYTFSLIAQSFCVVLAGLLFLMSCAGNMIMMTVVWMIMMKILSMMMVMMKMCRHRLLPLHALWRAFCPEVWQHLSSKLGKYRWEQDENPNDMYLWRLETITFDVLLGQNSQHQKSQVQHRWYTHQWFRDGDKKIFIRLKRSTMRALQ